MGYEVDRNDTIMEASWVSKRLETAHRRRNTCVVSMSGGDPKDSFLSNSSFHVLNLVCIVFHDEYFYKSIDFNTLLHKRFPRDFLEIIYLLVVMMF